MPPQSVAVTGPVVAVGTVAIVAVDQAKQRVKVDPAVETTPVIEASNDSLSLHFTSAAQIPSVYTDRTLYFR